MKTITSKSGAGLSFIPMAALLLMPAQSAWTEEPFPRWAARLDMGGTIPEETDLTQLGGPVSGEKFKLDPGFQFDLSAGYRFLPWLEVGPELGFTFNSVDSIGSWSYHNTTLGQVLMMANVRLEYPVKSRVAPFVGAGIGGAASFLTFGGNSGYYYYYDYEPDGTGSDFSLAFQLFGGVRCRVADNWNLGLEYRYLFTDPQHWNVDWWSGHDFDVSVDSIRMHSICLVFSGEF